MFTWMNICDPGVPSIYYADTTDSSPHFRLVYDPKSWRCTKDEHTGIAIMRASSRSRQGRMAVGLLSFSCRQRFSIRSADLPAYQYGTGMHIASVVLALRLYLLETVRGGSQIQNSLHSGFQQSLRLQSWLVSLRQQHGTASVRFGRWPQNSASHKGYTNGDKIPRAKRSRTTAQKGETTPPYAYSTVRERPTQSM